MRRKGPLVRFARYLAGIRTRRPSMGSDKFDMPTEEFDRLVDRVADAVATEVYLPLVEQSAYERAELSIAEARRSAEQTAAELKLC